MLRKALLGLAVATTVGVAGTAVTSTPADAGYYRYHHRHYYKPRVVIRPYYTPHYYYPYYAPRIVVRPYYRHHHHHYKWRRYW